MSHDLSTAIQQFQGRTGRNKVPADLLLIKLSRISSVYPEQSYNLLSQRTKFVERKAQDFFTAHNIQPMQPVPLDNGIESLVFDCQNGHVLKMRKGPSSKKLKASDLVSRKMQGYSQSLNVSYEVFEKVETRHFDWKQRAGMFVRCAVKGYNFADPSPYNMGLKTQKDGTKKPVIVDEGSLFSLNDPEGYYVLARNIFYAVGRKLPTVKPYMEKFKDGVKEVLHWHTQRSEAITNYNGIYLSSTKTWPQQPH